MFTRILISVIFALPMVLSGTASAGVAGSAHDINNGQDLCVNCHTPHNANSNMKPLWNHAASTASYTMYDSTFSTSLDMTVNNSGGNPTGISAACLSCHDGTVAIDSYGTNTGNVFLSGNESVGTVLTDDHPINIAYDPTQDPDFRTAADVTAAGLKFYNGQVECASCHDVHDKASVGKLLRISNTGSAMCVACHIK